MNIDDDFTFLERTIRIVFHVIYVCMCVCGIVYASANSQRQPRLLCIVSCSSENKFSVKFLYLFTSLLISSHRLRFAAGARREEEKAA